MEELNFPYLRKFAVGYFFHNPGRFIPMIRPYMPVLAEIYFPFPGILSAREVFGDEEEMRKQLVADLQEIRAGGIMLDLLINATCYGEKSYSAEWRHTVENAIRYLDENGVKPDVVTTMSPFVAKVVKTEYPEIDVRASVNLKIGSTLAMEYVSDLYDSFYMSRDLQRDLPTLQRFSAWCKEHGKKLCMLVNSGCVRNCPVQIFHETLLAHGFWRANTEASRQKTSVTLCWELFNKRKMFEEILRCTWIRPEDLHYYAPYADVFKLSTRDVLLDQDRIIRSYALGSYKGDLLDIIDPNFHDAFREYTIDNTAFPEDWVESGTAGKCAIDCTHCGKCTEVLEKVLKVNPDYEPPVEERFSFNSDHFSVGGYSFC